MTDWRFFDEAEKTILAKMGHKRLQSRFGRWLLRVGLATARAGKKDVTDLRGRWK